MRVLAGDIGGTNARVAVVDIDGREARVLHEQQFRSRDFAGLAPMIERFRAEGIAELSRACFAVPGPVTDGHCRPTNLPWTIDADELARAVRIPHTSLINDFVAVGHGIGLLGPADLEALQPGRAVEHGVIALLGPGTGLGQGFLVWDGSRYSVQASEGGHVDFAARDELEWRLFQSLRGDLEHVSYERVTSGPGLTNIYRYLAATGVLREAGAVREEIAQEDAAAVIVRHALAETDPLCSKAMDVFASVLGAQAGNLALTVLAIGGVYLAGGIAPRLVTRLKAGPFLRSFRCKGRLSGLLSRVPVRVIMNPSVGLLGAAAVAAEPS